MVNYGISTRSKPRIEVLKGFDPNEPFSRRDSHPVAANQGIKSGMVISKWWNATTSRYEWVKGVDVTTLGQDANVQVFFALQDETDHDVVNSGLLTGLSSSGQFEIETGYFKTGDTYNQDIPLTYDAATGNLKATTFDGTTPVVGICNQMHGLIDVAPYNSGVARDVDGKVLVLRLVTRGLPAND